VWLNKNVKLKYEYKCQYIFMNMNIKIQPNSHGPTPSSQQHVLYTWMGNSDFKGIQGKDPGPVADVVLHLYATHQLDRVVLLLDTDNTEPDKGNPYSSWLHERLTAKANELNEPKRDIPISIRTFNKDDPQHPGEAIDYVWVYDCMRKAVQQVEAEGKAMPLQRHYLVGPGTPTMAACTLALARLRSCAGKLWQTDKKHPQGCRELHLPFDLSLIDAPDPNSTGPQRSPGAQTEDRRPVAGNAAPSRPIVESASTRRAWELATKAARSQWPVLILGSTGVGKEELARHLANQVHGGKCLAVNCGAMAKDLLEAKLFGHKKGAFSGAIKDQPGVFEEAGDGILFLDEIGELSPSAQSRFLRVLQEKKVTPLGQNEEISVHCRIVAATHRNLLQDVQEKRFREDLYYRLAGLIIQLDDLKDRPEDLAAMVDTFWAQTVQENSGFPGRELSGGARKRLLQHPWPGNVRELRATLVRLAFLAEGNVIYADDVDQALGAQAPAQPQAQPATAHPEPLPDTLDMKRSVKQYRQQLANRALALTHNNKTQAASKLGITVQQLGRILKATD